VKATGLCLRESFKLRCNELSPQRIEDGVPLTKTTLKPYDSMPSHLQARASLSAELRQLRNPGSLELPAAEQCFARLVPIRFDVAESGGFQPTELFYQRNKNQVQIEKTTARR
jgi:hypothetical protein